MKSKAMYVLRLLAALTLPLWFIPACAVVLLSLLAAGVHEFAKGTQKK